ncbi:MAG TPA: sulfur carrier protein ThiS [Gemmatimonadaceae bacterium]
MTELRRLVSLQGAATERSVSFVTEAVGEEVLLIVNGAEKRVPAGWSLADLLASLELDARTVVIERNGTILRDRSSFASLELAADDSLEIVHFVGGG